VPALLQDLKGQAISRNPLMKMKFPAQRGGTTKTGGRWSRLPRQYAHQSMCILACGVTPLDNRQLRAERRGVAR